MNQLHHVRTTPVVGNKGRVSSGKYRRLGTMGLICGGRGIGPHRYTLWKKLSTSPTKKMRFTTDKSHTFYCLGVLNVFVQYVCLCNSNKYQTFWIAQRRVYLGRSLRSTILAKMGGCVFIALIELQVVDHDQHTVKPTLKTTCLYRPPVEITFYMCFLCY